MTTPKSLKPLLVIGSNTPREFGIQERRPRSQKALRQEFCRTSGERLRHSARHLGRLDRTEGPITESAVTESRSSRVEPEKTINPDNEKEIAQIEDAYARFTRWQKGVDEGGSDSREPGEDGRDFAKTDRLRPRTRSGLMRFADRLEGHSQSKGLRLPRREKAAAAIPRMIAPTWPITSTTPALPHRDRGTYLKLAHGTGRIIVAPKKKESAARQLCHARACRCSKRDASLATFHPGGASSAPNREQKLGTRGARPSALIKSPEPSRNPKRSKSRLRSPPIRFASSRCRRNSPTTETSKRFGMRTTS